VVCPCINELGGVTEQTRLWCVLVSVPGKGKTRVSDMEGMLELMKLVFHCVNKVAKMSLSKEVSTLTSRFQHFMLWLRIYIYFVIFSCQVH